MGLSSDIAEVRVREYLSMHPRGVVVVAGPTASGKTDYGIRLAEALAEFRPEIVNLDSRQIYRGLCIGSAAPTAEERARIPHHLVEAREVDDIVTTFGYRDMVEECVDALLAEGKLPILVGGHTLLISALILNYGSPGGESPEREELRRRYDTEGGEVLWQELNAKYPDLAAGVHPNNRHHLVRTMELGERAREKKVREPKYDFCGVVLDPPREQLYANIDARVLAMLEMGLLDEAEGLFARYSPELPALRSHGYQELLPYFKGECGLEEAVERIQRHTRNYAKRQVTWLRNAPYAEEMLWVRETE